MFSTQHYEPSIFDINTLNTISRSNAALETVDLALQQSKAPIITTKFGPQSAVILNLISQVNPNIPVIWVDTGFHTEATHKFARDITESLALNLQVHRPGQAWTKPIPDTGTKEFETFVSQVKLDPFRKALAKQKPDYWFTGLRREQTELRNQMSAFQDSAGLIKVCPLIDWRDKDMDAYLAFHDLPSGHDYTDPTKPELHLECGLHSRL